MRKLISLLALFLSLVTIPSRAESPRLKAVMYVGGRFHDYKTMPNYLAEKITHYGNIAIDVKLMNEAADMAKEFKDPDFGKAYDVIIYDICYGESWQDGDYDTALKVAKAGKPAVFVHCAMHCYRAPRDTKDPKYEERNAICEAKWHAIVGMDTRVHDKYQAFSVEKIAKDNPIVRTFPDEWKTPGDELYNTIKMMPTATPLLQAKSPISGKVHTVAWTNTYAGKTRVFATTLGHDMKTGEDPAYHRLLAMGILWAGDKLAEDGRPAPGYAPINDPVPAEPLSK
jgi:hypothetical protein